MSLICNQRVCTYKAPSDSQRIMQHTYDPSLLRCSCDQLELHALCCHKITNKTHENHLQLQCNSIYGNSDHEQEIPSERDSDTMTCMSPSLTCANQRSNILEEYRVPDIMDSNIHTTNPINIPQCSLRDQIAWSSPKHGMAKWFSSIPQNSLSSSPRDDMIQQWPYAHTSATTTPNVQSSPSESNNWYFINETTGGEITGLANAPLMFDLEP